MDIPLKTIAALQDGYRRRDFTPEVVIAEVSRRIEKNGDDHVWILRFDAGYLASQIDRLPKTIDTGTFAKLPLYGIPFAIKDNMDVEGFPTTAACPDYAYIAKRTAPVVQKLLDAGAILVGKTNMTQFAIGLAGERSPYGIARNPYSSDHIPGGSSSGSAVGVASGLITFALGTDTAGSGRVPAALNNLVGVKPSRGLLSNTGVVPCCLSLDCVSIFANDIETAKAVFELARGYDAEDPFSREMPDRKAKPVRRIGILRNSEREFYGDNDSAALYERGIEKLAQLPYTLAEIDFAPFRQTAAMLYNGAFMAERDVAVGDFLRSCPDSTIPISRDAILASKRFSAADAFKALHDLKRLERITSKTWSDNDAIFLPTVPTTFSIAEVLHDPAPIPEKLSLYTNFVNLLDLSAVAIPYGFTSTGLPLGASLIGPAFADEGLLSVATAFLGAEG
jgi:allophanate hydrolase